MEIQETIVQNDGSIKTSIQASIEYNAQSSQWIKKLSLEYEWLLITKKIDFNKHLQDVVVLVSRIVG